MVDAAAWPRGEVNLPTVLFDDRFGDTETQAGTALLTRVRGVGLREFFEQLIVERFGNTRAEVADRHHHPLFTAAQFDGHLLARWREFRGVREQVG